MSTLEERNAAFLARLGARKQEVEKAQTKLQTTQLKHANELAQLETTIEAVKNGELSAPKRTGRPPLGEKAMSSTERVRRMRARRKAAECS